MRRLPPLAAIRAFEAAARTENFTAAAAELGMQAAARRTAGISKPRRPDRLNATPHLAAVDDIGLLEALPLGAAIFTTNDRKLWLEAGNKKFFELAGCDQAPNKFAETFKRYAEGTGGQFIQAFLKDAVAPDEVEIVEGEGVARRFLKLKLSPIAPSSTGARRCLVSVVDRTVEVRAENHLRAEMLRDSLTGLPNRLAFSEAIEAAGENVARDLEHDGDSARRIGQPEQLQ